MAVCHKIQRREAVELCTEWANSEVEENMYEQPGPEGSGQWCEV